MRKLCILGAFVAAVFASSAGSTPAGAKAERAKSARVVCVSWGGGGQGRFVLKSKPRKCTFVVRGEDPFGYNTVDMIGMRWSGWGGRRAKAKGKQVVNMTGPVRAAVTLKRPKGKCRGHRTYTLAVFKDPATGRSSRMPLDGCR